MNKFLVILIIFLVTSTQAFGYAVKVYDQWGNRIGTYRKEGDNFVLYDFYDKKVENPESLIKNPPNQKTLTQYTQYFYDENFIPIGSFSTGLWNNYGRYYPRRRYSNGGFCPQHTPGIVRNGANTKSILYEEKYPYFKYGNAKVNVIQTGF